MLRANSLSERDWVTCSIVLETQDKNIYSAPAFATDLFLLFRPTNGSQMGVLLCIEKPGFGPGF